MEIRQWMTTNYKNDHVPAFVEQRDGQPNIVVHAADFVGMSRAEAETLAASRNAAQIERAVADVERLRAELAAAEAHLARVRAVLG